MTDMLKAVRPVSEKDPSENESPLRVCFVCTGNTCRSPMAAAVANAMEQERRGTLPRELQSMLPRALHFDSRGLYADGSCMSEGALRALETAEIPPVKDPDYRAHISRTVTEEDAARFDLLCAVGAGHAMELLFRFPQYAGKIIRLPEDIPDPYGGDDGIYRRCLDAICASVRACFFSDAPASDEGRERDE